MNKKNLVLCGLGALVAVYAVWVFNFVAIDLLQSFRKKEPASQPPIKKEVKKQTEAVAEPPPGVNNRVSAYSALATNLISSRAYSQEAQKVKKKRENVLAAYFIMFGGAVILFILLGCFKAI